MLRVSVGSGTVDFPLPPFPLRDGTAVLQQIGARYLRAHTVAFHERLSSGPGQVVTSDWQLQAPASLAFHASDGSSGVIIGRKRWDKQGTARWIESPQTPIVPQPQLPWTAAPEDVVELPAARLGGREVIRVAFVDPAIPAWFTVAADARTKAVVRVDMVAPAHFMLDTYRGLDVPMKIRPPR